MGGFEVGINAAIPDAECIGYSEIDKAAIVTYETHYEHHNYGDITKINAAELPDFDLIVGGFPCQSFSVAGKRRGFDEARGTLFFDIARILKDKRPGHLVLENVKGLLNHDGGKTFQTILGILSDLGYRVEWCVLNSADFGVPQNRERVYIVGHSAERCGRQVFPITGEDGQFTDASDDAARGAEKFIKTRHLSQNGSLISDSITLQASEVPHMIARNQRGEVRKMDVSGTLAGSRSAKQFSYLVEPQDVAGVIDTRQGGGFRETDGIANTVSASYHKEHDNHGARPMIKQVNPGMYQDGRVYETDGISPTINPAAQAGGAVIPKIQVREATAKGYAEATVGDTINISVPNSQTRRGRVQKGLAGTLQTGESMVTPIATGIADRGRPGGTVWEACSDGIANTVRTAGGRGSTPHIAIGYRGHTPSQADGIAKTVKAGTHGVPGGEGLVDEGYRIRRLTPVECERLQGFPDQWTVGSDTARYKQCGNAVTTNVVEAVMRGLAKHCL